MTPVVFGGGLRRPAVAALTVYGALALAVLLQPYPHLGDRSIHLLVQLARTAGLSAVVTAEVAGFALNVVLFVPLTFLAAQLRPQWSWLSFTAAGLIVAALIELTQLWMPHRTASLVDVAANTLGALIGAVLARPRDNALRVVRLPQSVARAARSRRRRGH